MSMVGQKADKAIDQALRKMKGRDVPYGGVVMVYCGDFCQLPPVMDEALYNRKESSLSKGYY